jgi:hypothetical protein
MHADQLSRQQRAANIDALLTRLQTLAHEAEVRNQRYWIAKDALDALLQEIMTMPKKDRPTGEEMAKAVGRDRRRLYQIRNLADPSEKTRRNPRREQ